VRTHLARNGHIGTTLPYGAAGKRNPKHGRSEIESNADMSRSGTVIVEPSRLLPTNALAPGNPLCSSLVDLTTVDPIGREPERFRRVLQQPEPPSQNPRRLEGYLARIVTSNQTRVPQRQSGKPLAP
jgi:hypothetical protein